VTAAVRDDPRAALGALATLLSYPGEGFPEALADARAGLLAAAPAVARAAAPFLDAAAGACGAELEEAYARTFDWSATCGLEVGWHLYGEQYERGAFLVAMRARLREAGIEEGTELPDHLSSCLRWLARAEPAPGLAFARETLAPALVRMRKGLGEAHAGYAALLAAVAAAVEAFAPAEEPPGDLR
jgi:nitrate reductase delta subunit